MTQEISKPDQNVPSPRKFKVTFKQLRRYPIFPMFILSVMLFLGIFGPTLAPHDPERANIRQLRVPPVWIEGGSFDNVLGTDEVGRDVFSRVMHGARISLMVAGVSVTVGFLAGTSLGLISGYYGGYVDEIIMRIVDVWNALPFLMVALVAVIIFQPSVQLVLVLLALIAWAGFVRVVRAQVLTLRGLEYVQHARVSGARTRRIIWRHIFPGVINTAIVVATLNVGGLILAEASLSFLGAGIPRPTPAWGLMVADGKDWLTSAWWISVFPGIAIFLTVMSLNFMGDWMRDRFDPRLRQL
jgi:peptide/nickel transport system permease protein